MSSAPPPGDGQPDPYGQQPSYGQQPEYGQPNYGQQPGGYGQPAPYGQPRPTEPPASVKTAVNLLWASVALSVLSTLLTFTMLDSIVDTALDNAGVSGELDTDVIRASVIFGGIIGLVIGVGITVLLLVFIRKGANWARIVWTVIAGLGLLFSIPSLLGGQPVLLLLLSLVSIALTIAILVFLWKKESNPWFAKQPAF